MAITAQKISSNGLYQVNSNFDEVTFNPNSNVASTNMLSYSQDFTQWAKNVAPNDYTVNADSTAAPDGSTTADLIIKSTGVGSSSICFKLFTGAINTAYCGSIYVKAGGYSKVKVIFGNSAFNNLEYGGTFDLVAGTNNTISNGSTVTITSAGNSWWRITVTGTSDADGGNYVFSVTPLDASYNANFAGDGTSGVYLWGAQVESNNTASIYVPMGNGVITPAAKAKTVSPGIVYTSGALDEVTYNTQSGVVKNLLAYSQQIGNGSFWTVSAPKASVGSTTIIAPDGTATATQIIEDNTTSQYKGTSFSSVNSVTFNATVNNSLTYTISVFAKSISNRNLEIVCKETGTFSRQSYVGFSLTTGTVMYTSAFNGITVNSTNIVPAGNGWNRCIVTYTLGGAATGQYFQFNLLNGITSAANTYTGDGASSIYLWGAQVEQGSTATIYTPTGANATPAPAFVSRVDSSGNLYNPNYFDEVAATFTWTFTASTVGYSSTGWQGIQSKFTGGLADSNYFDTSSFWGSNKEDYASITAVFPTIYNISNVYLGPVDAAANGGWGPGYTNGDIQCSTDNTNWYTLTNATFTTPGLTRVFAVNTATKYIRLKSLNTSNWLAVSEFYFDVKY
jgi:hypothetical protein